MIRSIILRNIPNHKICIPIYSNHSLSFLPGSLDPSRSQPLQRRYPEGSSEEQLAQYVARLERIRGVRRAEPLHRLDMAVVLCHAGADEARDDPGKAWEKPGKSLGKCGRPWEKSGKSGEDMGKP